MLSLMRTLVKSILGEEQTMDNTQITFQSGDAQLAGTLTMPGDGDSRSVALLISGSGPIDRDSNMKRQSIDVMAHVAKHLAGKGIGSFRYDKRGVGESTGDYLSTGLHDNVLDARAAVDELRSRPDLHGFALFVVGHSEGAIIAAELAAADPSLAGAVLLAGSARSGEEVLRWQAKEIGETLPRPVKLLLRLLRQDVVKTQAKRLEQIRSSTADVIRMQMVKVNAKWLREFMAHDPSHSLAEVETPVLAITGSKDIQVDPADVARIAELVKGECTTHVPSGITHLLRSEDGPPTVKTYKKQAKRPVDDQVLTVTSDWIEGVTAERPEEA